MDKYHCVFPDITSTASATECTGLMYKPPVNREEYESYQELSGMEIPKIVEDADFDKALR